MQMGSVPDVAHVGSSSQQSTVPHVIEYAMSMHPAPEGQLEVSHISAGVKSKTGSAHPVVHGESWQKMVSTAPGTW